MSLLARLFAAAALVSSCLTATASGLANTASVYLHGEPGSWVSGAVGAPEATWVHGVDGIFSIATNFDQGASITYEGDNWWHFDFAAPTYDPVTNTNNGQHLKVGLYNNATRFPFNSPTKPGMDISGNGAGNNQESGWFRVLEVTYAGAEITTLAVDFRQYDENLNQTGPSLYGSLRFNSSIPLTPVPEPTTVALLLAGLGALFLKRRDSLRA